jgi:hypothetical protein
MYLGEGRGCQREALEYTRQDDGRMSEDGGGEIGRGERRGEKRKVLTCYVRLRLQEIRGVWQRLRRRVPGLRGEGREREHAPPARLLLSKQKHERCTSLGLRLPRRISLSVGTVRRRRADW